MQKYNTGHNTPLMPSPLGISPQPKLKYQARVQRQKPDKATFQEWTADASGTRVYQLACALWGGAFFQLLPFVSRIRNSGSENKILSGDRELWQSIQILKSY